MKKQPQTKKRMPKKKKITLIVAIVACVAILAGIGVAIYAKHYHDKNHADTLTNDELYEYNYTLTVFGRNAKMVGDKDVLILDTLTKTLGGNTEASFYIYRFDSDAELHAALRMTAAQIAENPDYECVGTGTVTLVGDSFVGMRNMKTSYTK